LFAALIWLVYPVQTQSVTYIVQRMNSMAAMFYILTFLLYAKGRMLKEKHKTWPWFAGCALAGLLALSSKCLGLQFVSKGRVLQGQMLPGILESQIHVLQNRYHLGKSPT